MVLSSYINAFDQIFVYAFWFDISVIENTYLWKSGE